MVAAPTDEADAAVAAAAPGDELVPDEEADGGPREEGADVSDVVPTAEVAPEVAPEFLLEAEMQEGSEWTAPEVAVPIGEYPGLAKILVVGDENLLFTAGMQQVYPSIEFTSATSLSEHNLESESFEPCPPMLRGRVHHMVDPGRLGKHFRQHEFDGLMLFLPGLAYRVPAELGTADRPLFAYRTHLFAFHILRHAKLILKAEGKVHLVWPEEVGLMTSPCGAAGIEMLQLARFCGCHSTEPQFEFSKLPEGYFVPFLFGDVQQVVPEWLSGTQILSYNLDKTPIQVPLSAALLLHADVGFVSIKDPTSNEVSPAPPLGAPLRMCLTHEAMSRKERLTEIYGPKAPEDVMDSYGLVPEPADEESLLTMPMEIFMLSFDELPHISQVLKFQVTSDQPQASTATLDVLDPRLPTRIARPNAAQVPTTGRNGGSGPSAMAKKRARPVHEDWGGMKFYCPLTQICTMTAERMRAHMAGPLYVRLAGKNPGWDESSDKRDLLETLEEVEAQEEEQKRIRKTQNQSGNTHHSGKGSGKNGGK